MRNRLLLWCDAIINLLLGVVLVAYPVRLFRAIGIPFTTPAFYPSILGAVLIGVGLALLIQLRSHEGLGLSGAVAINICGGLVLALWLLFGSLQLSTQGLVVLWALVFVLVGLSVVELVANSKEKSF